MTASAQALRSVVYEAIDERAGEIVGASEHVMRHPESGFREARTARFVAERLQALGLRCTEGLAMTGVKARMTGRGAGPTVAILGELDALISPAHPLADPATGAAHACGHNAQIAAMLGAAVGLQAVMDRLDGDVVLLACPAEECVELEWRLGLRAEGRLEFVVGKPELIRCGAFDDVDLAMITHTPSGVDDSAATPGDSHHGCVVKHVTFRGRAAHAGFPERGVNALKAATLALAALDARRDTWPDREQVRCQVIMTEGGSSVSIVPAVARIEAMLRARTLEGLRQVSADFDRCARAGALALGASAEIITRPAYLPHEPDANLARLARAHCAAVVGGEEMGSGRHTTSSTDVGDLSHVMPTVHPRSGGTHGSPHADDYWVRDHVLAAVNPAKWMATMVVDLLCDGAAEARRVVAEAPPKLTRERYLEVRRGLDGEEVFSG